MNTLAIAIYRVWGAWLVLRGRAFWVPCSMVPSDDQDTAECDARLKKVCGCDRCEYERERQRMEMN